MPVSPIKLETDRLASQGDAGRVGDAARVCGSGGVLRTAGSWRYLRSGYGSSKADFDIVNETGGRVASTPYEDKARLIAAAPDGYALAEAVVAYFGDDDIDPMLDGDIFLRDAARALLTKARSDA